MVGSSFVVVGSSSVADKVVCTVVDCCKGSSHTGCMMVIYIAIFRVICRVVFKAIQMAVNKACCKAAFDKLGSWPLVFLFHI